MNITSRAVAAGILLVVAAPGAAAHAQTRASGTAAISGIVISEASPARPLRRATVSLIAADSRAPLSTVTDDAGRFSFAGIPAGTYNVSASKPAYVGSFYGSTRPGRGPAVGVTVRDGERVTDVRIALTRGAVITGRLQLPSGKPAEGMTVIVAGLEQRGGGRRLRLAGGHATTDDRGEYRIYGLAPGDYVVQAQPSGLLLGAPTGASDARQTNAAEVSWAQAVGESRPGSAASMAPPPEHGRRVNYVPVFFPGTAEAGSAETLTLKAGEERGGVDFGLSLVETAVVSGVIVAPDGGTVRGAEVRLVSDDAGLSVAGMLSPRPVVRSNTEGTFVIPAVAPGRYRLLADSVSAVAPQAASSASPAIHLWAEQDVTVQGQDIAGLTLSLQPGMTVAGRVAFDIATKAPTADALAHARVTLSPASNELAPVIAAVTARATVAASPVAADGSFTITGVVPGAYRVAITMPGLRTRPNTATEAWTLTSVRHGGRDLLDEDLVVGSGQTIDDVAVRITDRPTELAGTLTDQSGSPAPGYPIVIFSTDQRHWTTSSRRVAFVRPSTEGRFRMNGLPAGPYYVAVIVDLDPSDLDDPAFLDALRPSATTVTLAEGVRNVQDLRLAPRR